MKKNTFIISFLSLFIFDIYSITIINDRKDASISSVVYDSKTNNPIDFADVIINDTLNNIINSTQIFNGNFTIDKLNKGFYYVTVKLLGYEDFKSNLIELKESENKVLPNIFLNQEETSLQEVSVTADKSKVVYKIDRKTINADASLVASGGTAVDVLTSSPSFRIDADGEISFRGSAGFLVYIDGKQSPLSGTQALQQISAANIEDIEIITTPSAKYKSDGDVGIINIKTKQNKSKGFSGIINVAATTLGGWNTDVLFNYQKKNSRFFWGFDGSEVKSKSDFYQIKNTIIDNYNTTSIADGTRHSNKVSYIGNLGWEYNYNPHHLLIELQAGDAKNKRGGDMSYYEHRTFNDEILNDNVYDSHDRYCNEKKLGQLYTEYTYKINDRGDKFSINGRLRHDWYALEYTESNLFEESGKRFEGTRGYEDEYHWDFDGNMIYELYFDKNNFLESGYQFTSYSEIGDYNIKYWDRQEVDFIWQDDLRAPFYYRRQIHSLYSMYNGKYGNFEVNGGLRGDYTLDRLYISVPGANRNIKRFNIFPSLHLGYNLSSNHILSFGYSYRTNRPGIWQLEPYITYEDYYTKKIGNPDIRPEYIHSFELGYRWVSEKGNTFNLTAYYRDRKDVTDRIRIAYEPGVTLDSLINAGNDSSLGLEASAKTKPLNCWDITFNADLYHYKFKSNYVGCSNASNTSYAVSMINNFKLTKTAKMQFDANLVGPSILTQGKEKAYCYFDLAFKKQLLNNKLSLSLVAHDIFKTARYYNTRSNSSLNFITKIKPKYPNFALSVTYLFNLSGAKEQNKAVSSGASFEGKDF
ncbi:MAG: outer membrane beta-barrel family protein [Bacteroidales bacterium]|nr:outer membrane beta-barrel family protein [Bacteroidales bacterium]